MGFIKGIGMKIQKKYLLFMIAVPLLTAASLFPASCPICSGSGYLASTPQMENVEIVDSKTQELYVTRDVCDAWIAYKYEIQLLMKNNGAEKAEGWIKLVLREHIEGRVMDTQYISVAIEGYNTVESVYAVWFKTGLDIPGRTDVYAEVIKGNVPDEICEGTGRVSVNTWLLISGFKESFAEAAREQHEYKPPVYYPPATEGGGWAE